jgi:hypothetical protein
MAVFPMEQDGSAQGVYEDAAVTAIRQVLLDFGAELFIQLPVQVVG